LRRGDFASARHDCDVGLQRYPTQSGISVCRLSILGWSGQGRDDVGIAWREFRAAERRALNTLNDPDRVYRLVMVASVLAHAGLPDSARSVLRAAGARASASDVNWHFQRAFVELALGDTVSVLASLGQYLQAQPQRRSYVAGHPWFAAMRGNA